MSIKRIIVLGLGVAGIAALLVQPVFAQGGKRMGPQMGFRMGAGPGIYAQLNLTADQQAKIKAVTESHQGDIKAIREDKNLTPAEKQTKMQAIRKDMLDEIDKILTPAQKEQLATLREFGIGQIFERLDLTADQKTKIAAIAESHKGEIKALREDKNLAPAEKRTKIQAIREGVQAEIGKILTPEQQKKLAEQRRGFGGRAQTPQAGK